MKFKRHRSRKITANVELTPLVDVVFQLLIFFMLSSTFVVQTSIPIEIPEAQGASKLEQSDIEISLTFNESADAEGPEDVYIDGTAINDWSELSATLAEWNRNNPDGLVLIRSDNRTSTGQLVNVLGLVTSAGIERYGIAASPPSSTE